MTGSVRLLPSGERAVLVEVADAAAAQRLAGRLRVVADPRIEDVVNGARTVLVVTHSRDDLAGIAPLVRAQSTSPPRSAPATEVEIAVTYDGEDLQDVACTTGLTSTEVITRHSQAAYTVEFIGFAPGFAYLTGLDPVLHLPRLNTPRTSVPAGSVAIAGGYSAVYPRSSPGGWRLLGRTTATLFDVDADPPALLAAGTRVRFVPQ
ncbi:MAG: 5-oxoprolinase subunit B family protein [Beutenbergiaceae bacterium]